MWLVGLLDSGLRRRASSSVSLSDLLAEVIVDVAAGAQHSWVDTPDVPPSAAVGIVRFGKQRVDYLVLADVSLVFRQGRNLRDY